MQPPANAPFGIDLVGLIGYGVSAMGRWLGAARPQAEAKARLQRVADAADCRRMDDDGGPRQVSKPANPNRPRP